MRALFTPAGSRKQQLHFLIAEQPRPAIDSPRLHALEFEVGFGAGDEEAGGLMEAVESLEVEVTAVHDIEGARTDPDIPLLTRASG